MAIRDLTSMISPGMRVSRSNVSSVPRQDPPVEEMRARSVENSEQEVRPQVRSESQSGTEARLEARDTYVVVSDDIPVAPPAPLKPDPIKPGEKLIWVIPSNSPLASELEPTGESIDIPDAAPQQQVAPALVRAEDPLTGALLSAGLGAGVGAGAKVLGSIGSKVAASAVGSGSKAGKVAAAVLKPVGGTTIRKVETSVAKATTPKIGGAVGSVMESAATPAKLPLNAATGIYAADVVGRVTAKDEQGNAPSAGEMGSRAAKIGLTEIVPFAAGAVVGGAAAGRVMQGVGTRRIESQFTRIPREDPVRRGWIYNDRQLREGRGRIYPEPSSSAARSGSVENVPILRAGSDVPPTPIRAKVSFPFSSDALSRVTTRNGEAVFEPAGRGRGSVPTPPMERRPYGQVTRSVESNLFTIPQQIENLGRVANPFPRLVTARSSNPFSSDALSRVTTRNGEAVFEPAGRQTNRMGYSAAKGLLPKMTNEEIRFARSLSEGGYSTVEIRNFIQMQRSSNDKVSTSWSEIRNRQQLENRLKSMSQTNRPAPITIPFGVIGTRINSSQSVSKSQSNVALNLFREHPQSSAISIPITPTNIATRPPASVLPAAPENLGNTHGTSILGRRSKQNGIIDAIFAPVAALPSRKSRTPIIFSTHRDIRQDTDMGNGNLPIWKMPTTTGTVPYTLTTPVGIVDQTVGQTQSTIPVSLTTMKPRQVPRRIQAEDIAPIYPSPRKGKMIWDMPDDNPFREPSQRKRKTKKSTFTETLW